MTKKMTVAQKAKLIHEMADMIYVRNHVLTLVNTGRTRTKEERSSLLKFADYVDQQVMNNSAKLLPEEVETIKNANQAALVEAKERQQKDRTDMEKQIAKAQAVTDKSEGVGFTGSFRPTGSR